MNFFQTSIDLIKAMNSSIFNAINEIVRTPTIVLPVCIVVIIHVCKIAKYKKTTYYAQTKCSYFELKRDKGRLGEYYTYLSLRKFEEAGAKFLFNVYVPKKDGGTTEIDVLMITTKGIFVFESKNYSGWIFGSENQKNWYQTLPMGKGRKSSKEIFLNPIMQNRLHIKSLKVFLGKEVPMHSVVVFSNRCTFRGLDIKNDQPIVYREEVLQEVEEIGKNISDCLSLLEIDELYNTIYPCSQVDDSVKTKHIANIINGTCEEYESSIEEKKDENNMNCPRCGEKLVLRKASKGKHVGKEFYGCSNFPKCRYLREVE